MLINPQQAETGDTSQPEATTCSGIFSSIQQLEKAPTVDLVTTHGGGQAMSFKSDKTERLEALRERARRQGCYGSSDEDRNDTSDADSDRSPDGPATHRERLSFDECFSKCRELTDRSAEQCFDSCR